MKLFKTIKKQDTVKGKIAKYELSFWFEHTGDCIWSMNETAKITYGYPVKPEQLPLSFNLIKNIRQLGEEYQTFLNWNDGSVLWSQVHKDDFVNRAEKIYNDLCEELGDDYIVINDIDKSI